MHHHNKPFGLEAPASLVWIPLQWTNGLLNLGRSVENGRSQVVVNLRICNSCNIAREHIEDQRTQDVHPSFGRLQDGREYVVYRCILYSDGFKQCVNRKGSAGGCYILPLNLPYEMRTSCQAVRAISLTPPGVSPNDVFRFIIRDIFQGGTSGFATKDEHGINVQLFLDVVGLVSDFLETEHWLDVTGHNGVACCPLCSFRRFQGPATVGSAYCLQTDAHSRDSAFLRCASRTEALRNSNF